MCRMDEESSFDYGDTVQVLDGEHKGRVGAVVGWNGSGQLRSYTVEFGDGSDADYSSRSLVKYREC